MQKIPSEITRVTLNGATYHGVSFVPTMINFFFGNNGTGKSTIGHSIQSDAGVEWRIGKGAGDYSVMVYNQEYINANIARYHNLDGVFTVNEINAEVAREVERLQRLMETASEARDRAINQKKEKEDLLARKRSDYEIQCWAQSQHEREVFEKTQDGRKQKRTFADGILAVTTPKDHDQERLEQEVDIAFRSDTRVYPYFNTISDIRCLDDLPGADVFAKRIVSSAGTDFARFVKALNATSWVREGHERYHTSDGICPYCQRKLPDTFEQDIRDCFDEQYEADIAAIQAFTEAYRKAANDLFVLISKIPEDQCPWVDAAPLRDKLNVLKGLISANLQKMQEKKDDSSQPIQLEATAEILQEIEELVEKFNKIIAGNNSVMADKPERQKICKREVWELLAFRLQPLTETYNAECATLRKEITDLDTEIATQKKTVADCQRQISEENKKSVNTRDAVDGMNALLRDSGFQGFELRERPGALNTYEVVRQETQEPARNLSEGERNFIAFLYFYQQVKGTDSADGVTKNKIVVIDDPVSSMDSSALFIVAALVREMIEVCRNNAEGRDQTARGRYIKQLFLLTHNAYFHREVTYSYVAKYEYVSFFLIRKMDNRSSITLCERANPNALTQRINYSPVHSTYAALWEEYREVKSAIPLLNVIRRILEYYFLQLCGYEGMTLRQRILKDNRDRFVIIDSNGNEDCSKLHMATAMLSYISTAGTSISDGINYIDECVDVEQSRETFALIFELMEQGQHYKMMTGESSGGNQNAIQL